MYGFCNSGLRKEKIGRSNASMLWTMVGPGESDHEKAKTRVTTLVAKTTSESHHVMSSHQRTDGKGINLWVISLE